MPSSDKKFFRVFDIDMMSQFYEKPGVLTYFNV